MTKAPLAMATGCAAVLHVVLAKTQEIPVENVIRGGLQDNIQLVQWFKKLFECHGGPDYNPARTTPAPKLPKYVLPGSSSSAVLCIAAPNFGPSL